MSVKVHEAYCLDSQQGRLLWWDDFLGDQVQDEWRDTGNGSAAVVDQQTGGIVRLTSGAVIGNNHRIDWNDIRSLLVTKRASMEVYLKLTSASDVDVEIALFFDASNRILFRFDDSVDTNWMIQCVDGGAGAAVDSGETPDTSYHTFRIECHTHGGNHVHFYIDGTETDNSPISTNVPDDATDYLQPYLLVETEVASNKTTDIDYVVMRQDI